MLSTQKRTNPFEEEDEVRMDVCSSAGKRGRWEDAPTPLRKRNFNQANTQTEPVFTLRDLEKAREEGKMQSMHKIRSLISTNDALRQALNEAVQEREKLAHDCKVLKAGVLTLNNRGTQLTRELEIATAHLREECEKNRQLQSAMVAMHANWSLGACRKDDHPGSGSHFDGDVF